MVSDAKSHACYEDARRTTLNGNRILAALENDRFLNKQFI